MRILKLAAAVAGFALVTAAAAQEKEVDAAALEAANAPYTIEPCCKLCPAAANRSVYNTKFLEGFATLVQGNDGWLFRSDDDLRTSFAPDATGLEGLKRLAKSLRERGTELVIVMQPPRALMHPDKLPDKLSYNQKQARAAYGEALNKLRKTGAIVPDLTPLLQEPGDEKTAYFFRADHHWTPYGAQRTARLVAETIKQMPAYKNLPKKKFITQRTGILGKKGTMQKAALLICGNGYPDQYVDRFVTEPAEAGAKGDDLFGDDSLPQVTLLGTSNSDSAYNFPGFLSEYLGVDILNEAITGGGVDGSLLRYLPSDEFQKSPPKILIWEIETYHNLSNRNFYREVLPRVYDGCDGRKAILTGKTNLKGTKSEVLFNGGGKLLNLEGRRHLIDLKFSDPSVRDLKGTIWYTNGSKESLSLQYSEYVEAGGRFITELRGDPGWGERVFMSLDLTLPEGVPPGVEVKATLCEIKGGQKMASTPPPKAAGKKKHAH